ncbi:hypothetical protein ACQP1G_16695 [Nocardia sp. CA-107356]|uniref:hypothetical protein n=1 Tax=Nocardia sp. CA-107356 TaxID=3239972 RepID=UPI003D933829
MWANATRRRRTVVRLLTIGQVLLVIWTVLSGVAAARVGTVASSGNMSAIDGLGWTSVKDSSGIPLSDYLFATNDGSVLDPEDAGLSLVLGLEFTVFMVVVISAIWLIDEAVSFRWLDGLDKALTAVADSLTHQIATPIMLIVSSTIGTFFVAWFVVRGYHAKAALQVVAMLTVAVLGATYLARPLADVLSPHGLLAQGRDVGISVAAGLNGDASPDADSIVTSLNATLGDNFARHPLQVWNFGHVVDDSSNCRTAWSSGVLAGSKSRVARGLNDCGDTYASAKIENPSMGQIGTGLVLLIFGTILLLFAAYLAIKIFLAALSSIYHAILAIFGFAAGGFIYGPTQTFLIRNLVDIVGDALSMVAYTVYLGVYVLVLGDMFRAASGSGMSVIFVGGMVMIAGFALLRRLDLSLIGGQSRVAEQIRATLAGKPAAAGGAATGMDTASLRYTLSPGHLAATTMRWTGDLNAINASPVTSWIFRRPTPLTYFSKQMQDMNYLNYELLLGRVPPRAAGSWMSRLTLAKNAHDAAARDATDEFGGRNAWAAAAGIRHVLDLGGDRADANGALRNARFSHELINYAIEANSRVNRTSDENPLQYDPLAKVAAALELVDNARNLPNAVERSAYIGQFADAARMFYRLAPRPMNRSAPHQMHSFYRKVAANWDKSQEDFRNAVPINEWASAPTEVRRYIGSRLAEELKTAAGDYYRTPSDALLANAMRWKDRAAKIDLILSNTNVGPWTN